MDLPQQVPIEKIVTDDVKALAREIAAKSPYALAQAVKAGVTINVGVALQMFHSEEDFNWYSEELEKIAHKIYKEELKKAKWQGVFEMTKSGIILPN